MSLYELHDSLQVRTYPRTPAIACFDNIEETTGVIAAKMEYSRRNRYEENDIKCTTSQSLCQNTHVSASGRP